MCGLVGAAGNLTFQGENAFKTLLFLDTIRGPHSTGVLIVPRQANPTPILVKELGTPWEKVIHHADYKRGMGGVIKLLLGHNRYATKGNITAENAHPFQFNHIIGAHNGTLHTTYQLKGHEKFEVDSQSLYSHLAEHGSKDTVDKLNGAFALTWYDQSDDSLHFCRNAQRPLWWCRSTDGRSLFWASEKWMLIVALSKHNITHDQPVEIEPLMEYSFNLAELAFTNFAKPRVSQLKAWSFPAYVGRRAQQSFFGEDGDEVYGQYDGWQPPHQRAQSYRPPSVIQPTNIFPQALPAPVVQKRGGAVSNELLGETIAFTFRQTVARRQSGNGAPYLRCVITDRPDVEVRVYLNVADRRWDQLAKVGGAGVGKVKKVSQVGGPHLVIDLRTMVLKDNVVQFRQPIVVDRTELTDDTPEDDNAYVPVRSNGLMVDHKTFDDMTAKGCCICTQSVDASQAKDIVWICNDEEFICPDCSDLEIAKQYINIM